MNGPSTEERLVELESRHLHLENLLDHLNGVVIEQRALIEALQRELARLREQVRQGDEPEGAGDEKPPHY